MGVVVDPAGRVGGVHGAHAGAAGGGILSGIREAHVVVRRTARYALLGEVGPALREVWFVCHGYRQLARFFLRAFLPVAGPERLFVAPEALSRFYLGGDTGPHGPDARIGATWMTREDREAEIGDYVGWLDVLHARLLGNVDRSAVRVRALGFSQGAHTVSRWIALGEADVDELVLWSGGFPPDYPWEAALPRLRPLELTLVAGTEDSWATPERVSGEAGSLRERGLSPRVVVFEGGHRVTEEGLRGVVAGDSANPRS